MPQTDLLLQELQQFSSTDKDYSLAHRHAPQIRFDTKEPFFPLAAAYSVIRSASQSPSSTFAIDPENGIAIEYAIWWDWDIQHLYELEHIWIYLDADETLLKIEASAHGGRILMMTEDGSLPLEDGRVTLFSEPGKHAFAPEQQWLIGGSERTDLSCGDEAGEGGILTGNPFNRAAFGPPTLEEHRLTKRYLQRLAFQPVYEFSQLFDLQSIPFVTWQQLYDWIPRRIQWWREELPRIVPHLRLICLDSGDTLVDEATEVKDGEVVNHAELIPGAAEMIGQLQEAGYMLALVADGPRGTFENVLQAQYGLWDAFSAFAISGDVGVSKPDARMFLTALNALQISQSDYQHVVMVGNNLERDIKGANELGLISIWINWSPRRSKIPADASEIPDYTINTPLELLPLLEKIELNLTESEAD